MTRLGPCAAAVAIGVCVGAVTFVLYDAPLWLPLLPGGVLLAGLVLLLVAVAAGLTWHARRWPQVRANARAEEQAEQEEGQWTAPPAPESAGPPGTRRCRCGLWWGPYSIVCVYCQTVVWKLEFALLIASALGAMVLLSTCWPLG